MVNELRRLQHGARDLAEVVALLRRAFPGERHLDHAYLQWCYVENPEGRALGFNAYHEGGLVAHYVTQPLRARIEGEEERGLLSLHTATHPDHQGQGLFTQLARRTFEEARAAGAAFVVGVANAASTPGFIRRLGFQLVAPLEARLGFGPPRFARTGADAAPCFAKIWTPELLQWRVACPARRYTQLPDGTHRTVYAATGRGGILAELGSFPDAWLPETLGRPSSWNPLRLWLGLEPAERLGPYIPLPDRLRPSPLNLIFLDLSGRRRSLDPSRVRFQAIDFDAY